MINLYSTDALWLLLAVVAGHIAYDVVKAIYNGMWGR